MYGEEGTGLDQGLPHKQARRMTLQIRQSRVVDSMAMNGLGLMVRLNVSLAEAASFVVVIGRSS